MNFVRANKHVFYSVLKLLTEGVINGYLKKIIIFADSRGAGTNILKGVGGPNAYSYRNLSNL